MQGRGSDRFTRGSRTRMGLSRGHLDRGRGRAQIPGSSSAVFPAVLRLSQAYPGAFPVLPARGAGAVLTMPPPHHVPPHVLSPTQPPLLPLRAADSLRYTEGEFQLLVKLQSGSLHKPPEKKGSPCRGLTAWFITGVFSYQGRAKLRFWNFLPVISASEITSCFVCF